MQDWIAILDAPLNPAAAIAFVTDERAGGVAVFLGTTRTETASDGKKLIALDYEAYREMAQKQLVELLRQARAKWPIIKAAVLHRVGRVALAEPSVIVAVSTPHRAEAFEAARFLIDELKKEAAIWKKEVWEDGSGRWVESAVSGPKNS